MTKKQIRLIAGVSMYCIMLCMAFAVRGLNPRPAELPEPDPPEITAQDPVELAHVVQTKPLVYRTPEAAPEPIPVTDPEPPLLNVIEHCTVTYYVRNSTSISAAPGMGSRPPARKPRRA